MGTQTIAVTKIADLFKDINPETVTSVIAIKDGEQPLVYLMAVPYTLKDRLANLMGLACIRNVGVLTSADDYGDEESKA